jgi:hypothetical protein
VIFYIGQSVIGVIASMFIWVFIGESLEELPPSKRTLVKVWVWIAFIILWLDLLSLGWNVREDLMGFFPT